MSCLRMTPLSSLIAPYPLLPFGHHSRVHKLHSFSYPGSLCYVKRDDELGFGISGSKLRKYLSLIPALVAKKPQQAIVMGSNSSNHVLSVVQLLREAHIEPILFLLGDPTQHLRGNSLWIRLFVDHRHIHWVPRGNWDKLDTFAQDYQAMQRKKGIEVAIIPKGGNCQEAIPGALTLGEDIVRNEQENKIHFDHIILDAGTAMMASTLLLGFAWLHKLCKIHIVLIAQSEEEFHEVLHQKRKEWELLFGSSPPVPCLYKTYLPQNAPSFGSTNAAVFTTIATLARQEGFLTDPIFTAKLFDEGKRIITEERLEGHILFIHSGGTLSLSGFQEQMIKHCFF